MAAEGHDVALTAVGAKRRAVKIYTMDGLGMRYGSGITYWLLKPAGIGYSGIHYIARSFIDLVRERRTP